MYGAIIIIATQNLIIIIMLAICLTFLALAFSLCFSLFHSTVGVYALQIGLVLFYYVFVHAEYATFLSYNNAWWCIRSKMPLFSRYFQAKSSMSPYSCIQPNNHPLLFIEFFDTPCIDACTDVQFNINYIYFNANGSKIFSSLMLKLHVMTMTIIIIIKCARIWKRKSHLFMTFYCIQKHFFAWTSTSTNSKF